MNPSTSRLLFFIFLYEDSDEDIFAPYRAVM